MLHLNWQLSDLDVCTTETFKYNKNLLRNSVLLPAFPLEGSRSKWNFPEILPPKKVLLGRKHFLKVQELLGGQGLQGWLVKHSSGFNLFTASFIKQGRRWRHFLFVNIKSEVRFCCRLPKKRASVANWDIIFQFNFPPLPFCSSFAHKSNSCSSEYKEQRDKSVMWKHKKGCKTISWD